MDYWVEFSYRDFCDVPRMLVVKIDSHLVLLVSRFRQDLDEYDPYYTCYLLPEGIDLSGSWESLEARAIRNLGRTPVVSVRFDPTRRSAVDFASTGISLPD